MNEMSSFCSKFKFITNNCLFKKLQCKSKIRFNIVFWAILIMAVIRLTCNVTRPMALHL